MENNIALLIDAENISAEKADAILEYVAKQGNVIVKRAYGDFAQNKALHGWNKKAIQHEIQMIQVITTRAGKNASDIELVVEGMELLFQNENIDVFCIVTSDGDYASFIRKVREKGKTVIGIGKKDASKRLERICDRYLDFDAIEKKHGKKKTAKKQADTATEEKPKKTAKKQADTTTEEKPKKTAKKQVNAATEEKPKKTAKKSVGTVTEFAEIDREISSIVRQETDAGKRSDLGGIKSRIQLKYPDFKEKNYGYKNMRELIEKGTHCKLVKEGRTVYVEMQEDASRILEIEAFMEQIYPKRILGIHELGTLARKIQKQFPGFSYKEYGFSKFANFVDAVGFQVY